MFGNCGCETCARTPSLIHRHWFFFPVFFILDFQLFLILKIRFGCQSRKEERTWRPKCCTLSMITYLDLTTCFRIYLIRFKGALPLKAELVSFILRVVCVLVRKEPRTSGSYQGHSSSAAPKDRDTRPGRILSHNSSSCLACTIASAVDPHNIIITSLTCVNLVIRQCLLCTAFPFEQLYRP